MEPTAEAAVTSKLEDAIDKVLESTATIAQFSKRGFEEYVRILAPARLGIYVTLQGIYADRPDLRPQDLSEQNEGEALVVPEVPDIERAFDGEAMEHVKTLLRDAQRLLNEAQVGMRFVPGLRLPSPDSGLPTLEGAADAISEAIARLAP
jgi:hypothetical protein